MIPKAEHCNSCGEWLDGYDLCPECGMIQVK
jgi:ribosomal protein L32